ncbi:mammalian cell entry protein [Variovorax paradoxus]|jgi:paraquat-inducible protein B|uniref:PqiB family protein n=1 Tax=Variovorax TaxID=34072 RepID=UPI0006E5D67A|nr:MlaD family protein [Variovorax sp. CY25R-8]KPU90221.1 mammalian cell entry protein [Variovorax paradoxus]KPU92421.1 mammalian cell entry protein [Variovorax paradoxus]KPV02217.1 mammalian cell entry protein [Variovorax paradoxus]KPV10768.1 mammalian cell entry protein [Variovorax paradoxus]KPV15824.1 mammalian cell entry protein [Variovorax paradoxus]
MSEEERPQDRPAPSAPPLPRPQVKRRREWLPSLIWLIPIVAALVGVMLVARILMERGPEIVLTFKTAEGLEAGKTAVKYKDVQIGLVQSLRLARDRSHVRVLVQLNKEAEGFTSEDSRFWVVRPRLDTSGISGLNTLLSGAYIGADAGVSKETSGEFKGLEAPPIVTRDDSGQQFLLRAADIGSLDVGSPVYFRRIKVGQVAAYELDGDGRGVTLRVFVNAPYDKFVGVNTRFWQASGIDAQLSASGFTLRTQSLATILLGGIAFQAPDDAMGPLAKENTAFMLAADETTAMKEPDGPSQTLLMYFNQSLRGLVPGAPVDFRGVVIGEVKSIGVEFDRAEREFRMPVLVQIYPDRLRRRSTDRASENEPRFSQQERLRFLTEKGLRAQLRNGNLITGSVYVALDFFPKAPPAKIDLSKSPIELPTMANSLDEIQSQVQEIASKLNKVPYEQIAQDLRTTLATLNKTLTATEQTVSRINNDVTPELAAAMKDVRKTVNSAERTLADDSPLQQDTRQMLQELTRAAGSVRVLTDYLERHPESLLRGKPDDKK